jgi:hypothetical protein
VCGGANNTHRYGSNIFLAWYETADRYLSTLYILILNFGNFARINTVKLRSPIGKILDRKTFWQR